MTYNYSDTIDYLLDWYDLNARILAWRENPKPYYVWVSEIMLQQTRVEAVKFYFDRFIQTLPDIKSLAEAEEEILLKLWEGLGYYNRVRNLQKAARVVTEEYQGELPADYEALLKLPGIGTYTAGAIISIAYHIPQPAVDGNVLRVMKRVSGSFDDITKAKVKKDLEQDIREIMPKDRPGDFNQSLMELGATVCIPNGKPLCEKCPIMHLCKAFHQGTQMLIPVKPEKKPRKIEEKTILLFEKNGEYAVRKRDNKGLLAGLWEFPNLEGKLTAQTVEQSLSKTGIINTDGKENYTIKKIGEGKHIFSHVEWHMIGYYIHINEDLRVSEAFHYDYGIANQELFLNGIQWADKEKINKEYTIPTAFEIFRGCIV